MPRIVRGQGGQMPINAPGLALDAFGQDTSDDVGQEHFVRLLSVPLSARYLRVDAEAAVAPLSARYLRVEAEEGQSSPSPISARRQRAVGGGTAATLLLGLAAVVWWTSSRTLDEKTAATTALEERIERVETANPTLVAQEASRYLLREGDMEFNLGAKIMVASKTGRDRVCTVIDLTPGRVQVHYDGFPSAFDEWLQHNSSRLLGVAETSTSTTLTTTTLTGTSTVSSTTSTSATSTTVSSTTSTSRTSTTTTVSSTTSTSVSSTTTTTPRRYVSLFCFTLVRSWGYELELVRLQVAKSVSIFECDESSVFSDKKTWLSQGPTYLLNNDGSKPQILIQTMPIQMPMGPEVSIDEFKDDADGAAKKLASAWQNARYFVECWKKVLDDGRYKFHDWVVKVDPDTAFFPSQLRARLGKTPFKQAIEKASGAYVRTCAVTPRKCLFAVTLSRAYGDDWSTVVIGESGDSFAIGHCDATSDAGKGCIDGGWGDGINTITNQHGENVGLANCCNENNQVVSADAKCPQEQTSKTHQGISGALEIYTRSAIEVYAKKGTKCVLDTSYKKWGEEYFMLECMDSIGAEPLDGTALVKDKYCNGVPKNCSTGETAFHPIKSVESYFQCMAENVMDLSTVEMHQNLLRSAEVDG